MLYLKAKLANRQKPDLIDRSAQGSLREAHTAQCAGCREEKSF